MRAAAPAVPCWCGKTLYHVGPDAKRNLEEMREHNARFHPRGHRTGTPIPQGTLEVF